MDLASAQWLVSADACAALKQASSYADPDSLAAATAMRKQWTPPQAATALTQISLRRKAQTKFGDRAAQLFFTADGLQQATRLRVSAWRAGVYQSAGIAAVLDLGCGLGFDALAFAQAGIAVRAVEIDAVTAVLAAANTADSLVTVINEAAQDCAPTPSEAVFLDPARRTQHGRSWRVEDLSPSWDFCVESLRGRFGCLKAGPGLKHALIPDDFGAVWVSESGDLVELALWSGSEIFPPGSRTALLLGAAGAVTLDLQSSLSQHFDMYSPATGGVQNVQSDVSERPAQLAEAVTCRVQDAQDDVPGRPVQLTNTAMCSAQDGASGVIMAADIVGVSGIGKLQRSHHTAFRDGCENLSPEKLRQACYLYEPDPAIIRGGGVAQLATHLGAILAMPNIAYLFAGEFVVTPFARVFEIQESFPYSQKALRAWCRERSIGILEIKCRGVDIDPAILRRQLKLRGDNAASVVITPTAFGVQLLIVQSLKQ